MNSWKIRQAVQALNSGEVMAYPTEAVYGLGCDPWDIEAVEHLLWVKQRPWQKGLILIAASFEQLETFVAPVSQTILQKITQTWPGPTTWLLPASAYCPDYLTGEHDTIAVRVTAHKQAKALCQAFGGAIVSTSANRARMKPATTARQVKWNLPEIKTVLTGSCGGATKPTAIRDAQTGEKIR